MRRAWLIVVAATGCFHPEPPAGAPCSAQGDCPSGLVCTAGVCGGAPGDAPGNDGPLGPPDLFQARVRVGATVVRTSTAGVVTVQEVVDTSAIHIVLDDGTEPDVTFDSDGTAVFSRNVAHQPYMVKSGPTEIDADTTQLIYLPPVFGRLAPAAITTSSLLDVNVAHGSLSGGSTVMFATNQRAGLLAPSPFTFTSDWALARTQEGRPAGLLDSTAGDVLWLVHEAQSNSVTVIDGTLATLVDQVDGSTTPVTGTVTQLALQGCVTASGPAETERLRFKAALPAAQNNVAVLGLSSQPAASSVTGEGFAIAFVSNAPDGASDVPYAMPFPGEDLLGFIEVQGTVQRSIDTNGTKINTLATLKVHAPVDGGAHACGAPGVMLPAGGAIATGLTINATALTGDRQQIPSNPVSETFTVTTSTGAADIYTSDLVDRTANATVGRWVTTTPSFAVPHGLFAIGHFYTLTTTIDVGYPLATSGDLTTLTYPTSTSTVTSFTFTML